MPKLNVLNITAMLPYIKYEGSLPVHISLQMFVHELVIESKEFSQAMKSLFDIAWGSVK